MVDGNERNEEELPAGDEADAASGSGAGRQALKERLRAAGGRLDDAMVTGLAGIAMAEREEKGQALFTAYLQNEVSEEYCNEAAGLLGYGLWWGEETRWRIAAVAAWKADPPAGIPCRLTLECSLVPEAAPGVPSEAGGVPARKTALIEMDVSEDLAVPGFRFQWK